MVVVNGRKWPSWSRNLWCIYLQIFCNLIPSELWSTLIQFNHAFKMAFFIKVHKVSYFLFWISFVWGSPKVMLIIFCYQNKIYWDEQKRHYRYWQQNSLELEQDGKLGWTSVHCFHHLSASQIWKLHSRNRKSDCMQIVWICIPGNPGSEYKLTLTFQIVTTFLLSLAENRKKSYMKLISNDPWRVQARSNLNFSLVSSSFAHNLKSGQPVKRFNVHQTSIIFFA